MSRLLVVSPHADDAELGCGGYMHKVAWAGGEVLNLVVTVNDTYFFHLNRVVTFEERIAELKASMNVLGGEFQVLYADRARSLDIVSITRVIDDMGEVIRIYRPSEILIPLPSSHQEHEFVYRASVAACRPSQRNDHVRLIAAYEYPATSWGAGSSADAGKGGMYVELTQEDLDAKCLALACYQTQMRPEGGHCWSTEAARALARIRGIESGLSSAELFHVMRAVRPKEAA